MTFLDTILTIAAGLFGSLNILQLVTFRQTKQKATAEAKSAVTAANKDKTDLHQSQYDYVIEKLSMYQKMYYDLNDQVMDDARKYSKTIAERLDEIAGLKSQIIILRGVSCGRYDCRERIPVRTVDADHPAPEARPNPEEPEEPTIVE